MFSCFFWFLSVFSFALLCDFSVLVLFQEVLKKRMVSGMEFEWFVMLLCF